MQIVDLLPVDLRGELRNLVESGFLSPPIEALPPVSRSVPEGKPRARRGRSRCERPAQDPASGLRPVCDGGPRSSESVISICERFGCCSGCHTTTLEAIAEEFVPRLLTDSVNHVADIDAAAAVAGDAASAPRLVRARPGIPA